MDEERGQPTATARRAPPAPRPGTPALHAATWLGWAVSAAVAVQVASSPVYVALAIGVALVVVAAHARATALSAAFPLLLAVGASFALLRVALTAVTVHGVGSVWFTVPAVSVPRLLGGFTIGGTIEGPVVLGAAAEGFAVVGIVATFAAFNAVVSRPWAPTTTRAAPITRLT